MSGEAGSRSSLELPGVQEELAKALYETGKPVIAVLMNGRPLAIPWLAQNLPAIVEGWFLGHQAGAAIADVLFGDYNPSGKLPVTFPVASGQVPAYYNHKSTGRPGNDTVIFSSRYKDITPNPLYPFGFGLSYTKFDYSNLNLNANKIKIGEEIKVSVDVKNSGNYDGEEVVQLYVSGYSRKRYKTSKGIKRIQKSFSKERRNKEN